MADSPKTRSLIHLPEAVRKGQPFEVRATLGHPMENGLRADGYGNIVARDLVTRFECRHDGVLVCSIDLFPAIAANPDLAFWVRANAPGTLVFEWFGDNGFRHRESRAIVPA
jgi:sulfur-oxidizing protein SoxZ